MLNSAMSSSALSVIIQLKPVGGDSVQFNGVAKLVSLSSLIQFKCFFSSNSINVVKAIILPKIICF